MFKWMGKGYFATKKDFKENREHGIKGYQTLIPPVLFNI